MAPILWHHTAHPIAHILRHPSYGTYLTAPHGSSYDTYLTAPILWYLSHPMNANDGFGPHLKDSVVEMWRKSHQLEVGKLFKIWLGLTGLEALMQKWYHFEIVNCSCFNRWSWISAAVKWEDQCQRGFLVARAWLGDRVAFTAVSHRDKLTVLLKATETNLYSKVTLQYNTHIAINSMQYQTE